VVDWCNRRVVYWLWVNHRNHGGRVPRQDSVVQS
jgi:hypothetical protein